MNKLILILALFCTLNSFGQPETKEGFVNEVYRTAVDSAYSYYYLAPAASAINWHYENSGLMRKIARLDSLNNQDKSELLESIAMNDSAIRQVPGSILEELYNNAAVDTIEGHWDFSLLDKATPISPDSIRMLVNSPYFVKIKKGWSEKKKERRADKQVKKQQKVRDSRLEEQKNVFFFSKPIFNKNKEYAVISMEKYCGSLCAYRCIYLFRKINGKWSKVTSFSCWVS